MALDSVAGIVFLERGMEVVQLRIGETLRAAEGQRVFERVSPLSGAVVTRAAAASVADAQAAVAAAEAAFDGWSESGPGKRRELLQAAAQIIQDRREHLVRLMVAETGTSVTWAQFNVQGSVQALREAAALTTQVGGDTIPSDRPGALAMTLRLPVGVVLGMAPWNAPLLLGVRAIAMPLACGNTVVLKASELCPASHAAIGEIMSEAGFPPGVVNVISHDAATAPAVVEAMIAHPAVRRVNFTGSTRVGRVIGELAGRHLKPALLELGGKAPLVVLEDADLEQAVAAAAFGAFMNQGQICMSTERIVVEQGIADDFAAALAGKAASVRAGDPREGDAVLGAMIGEAAVAQVQALVEDAVSKGARLMTPLSTTGNVVQAVVLDHVRPGMRVYDEESFGPIAAIVRVQNSAEAIRVANDTEYGLAAAVFGRDLARTLKVARRIQAGVCHINGATVSSEPQLPFGGMKNSGYGRFGGRAAIQEFTELRVLTMQTEPQVFPI